MVLLLDLVFELVVLELFSVVYFAGVYCGIGGGCLNCFVVCLCPSVFLVFWIRFRCSCYLLFCCFDIAGLFSASGWVLSWLYWLLLICFAYWLVLFD